MSIIDDGLDVEAALVGKPEAEAFDKILAYINKLEARLEDKVVRVEAVLIVEVEAEAFEKILAARTNHSTISSKLEDNAERAKPLRMTKHFNKLTPPEAERLSLLLEEMGEAIQAVGKIQRRGYESCHPVDGPTNRESLERELGDVRHAMIRLCDAGDLSKQKIHDRADMKAETVSQYLHHND